MASFTLKAKIAAPPETVFDVLTDHRAYPSFTPLRSVKLEREGDPAPNGVGAIRVLALAGPPIREEVTEYDRPRRFVYRALSGIPVRDHVGTVELAPADGGTELRYHVDTHPTVPVGGFAVVGVVRLAIQQLLGGIVKESERRAGGA